MSRYMVKILVVDGQGGGIGKALIEKLKAAGLSAEIVGVGTNVAATNALIKAGADAGATGENAVVYNAARADIITGGSGILCANAMMGEISPGMAAAISQSNAVKMIVPLNRCRLRVCGLPDQPLPMRIDMAAAEIVAMAAKIKEGQLPDLS